MKRIISAVLIVLNILTALVWADGNQVSQIQKDELKQFGIMQGDENGDLRLNDGITRAEAVKMICTAGNIDVEKYNNTVAFPDVSESHWASAYIAAAKDNYIINGDENGNFNPEADITNEEIVKMIVCLLGYGARANDRGGYPAGYTSEAVRLGISSGLSLKIEVPAVRNDVAVMIYNALDVPLMVEQGEDIDVYYVILDGKNGIEKRTLRLDLESK